MPSLAGLASCIHLRGAEAPGDWRCPLGLDCRCILTVSLHRYPDTKPQFVRSRLALVRLQPRSGTGALAGAIGQSGTLSWDAIFKTTP